MNKRTGIASIALAAVLSGSAWWLHAQNSAALTPLASVMPRGALIYLEAKDFQRLLNEWNNSTEKTKWLAGANYDVLAKSRLILRLQQAQTEFETASGISAEMKLLQQVAGKESAFAFYNLGALKFVFLTRLDGKRIEASSLWQQRTSYQPRQASNIPFFVKQDAANHRTIAFASKDDFFVVATDEALMAAALDLLAAHGPQSLANDGWFQQLTTTARQGDLRLAYDLQAVGKTPQFRTYWIQQNQTELKQYLAGLSDLFEVPDGFDEQRTLLRTAPLPAPAESAALANLASRAAQNSSLYRAWANPSTQLLTQTIRQVVYGDAAPGASQRQFAPTVELDPAAVGSQSDLETRIDEPVAKQQDDKSLDAVVQAITAMGPAALLHVQTSVQVNDHVFIIPESTVAIFCAKPNALALQANFGNLDPLKISVQGNLLILARGETRLQAETQHTPNSGAVYLAGYNHAEEWPKYTRLFRPLDGAASNVPTFFSGNVQSLGDTLSRLQQATIARFDHGPEITETVHYIRK